MDFDELNSLLDPIQDRIAPDFVKPYEGLSERLASLGSYGIKLAVFTSGTPHHVVRNFGAALPELGLVSLHANKSVSDAEKLITLEDTMKSKFGIPEVAFVTVGDTVHHKPAPDSLLLAMQRLDVTPERTLVLGDHAVDMQAGVNANALLRIGITHGFQDETTLLRAGATDTVSSLAELEPYLADAA
jgi:beta-phosphoglucomutase-like phosphatase (HAD superfamily)